MEFDVLMAFLSATVQHILIKAIRFLVCGNRTRDCTEIPSQKYSSGEIRTHVLSVNAFCNRMLPADFHEKCQRPNCLSRIRAWIPSVINFRKQPEKNSSLNFTAQEAR